MLRLTISRHTAGRETAVTNFNPKDALPGGVNVVFCRHSCRAGVSGEPLESDLA